MAEWLKVFASIKDQSLLLLGVVVSLVLWLGFRLLKDVAKMIVEAYREAEAQKTEAIRAMAKQTERNGDICHSHTIHLEHIREALRQGHVPVKSGDMPCAKE